MRCWAIAEPTVTCAIIMPVHWENSAYNCSVRAWGLSEYAGVGQGETRIKEVKKNRLKRFMKGRVPEKET